MSMFYTYVLRSKKDYKWYTGCTNDLRNRFMRHNKGQIEATEDRQPFELLYYEACHNQQDAFAREKYLKTGMGKRYIKNRIKRFLSLTGRVGLILIIVLHAKLAFAGLIIKAPPYIGLQEGLVGFWSFDGPDMSQSTNNVWALDRSGQGNNGVLKNMATSTARVIGKLGQALDLDGVNDLISISNSASIQSLETKTISAWIYPRSAGEDSFGTIYIGEPGVFKFSLCSNIIPDCTGIENTLTLFYAYDNDNGRWRANANVIKYNQWQHVTVVYNTSSTNALFYINGESISVTTISTPTGNFADDNGHVIGSRLSGSDAFDGQIDEVRVYNRALSADEIKRLYNMGR